MSLPDHMKLELRATRPDQARAWDITKLHISLKWVFCSLYNIIYIYNRYTGWMTAHREISEISRAIREETHKIQQIIWPSPLVVQASRSTLISKPIGLPLTDPGIRKMHSLHHLLSDNPFSGSRLKALKNSPEFPDRLGCLENPRVFFEDFLDWHNRDHYQSDLRPENPRIVHSGPLEENTRESQDPFDETFADCPDRIPGKLQQHQGRLRQFRLIPKISLILKGGVSIIPQNRPVKY